MAPEGNGRTTVDIEANQNKEGAFISDDEVRNPGYHLRWSRITKTVLVKDDSGGLIRSSLGGSINSSGVRSSKTKSEVRKAILKSMSGEASPGQILALMGPSGSGKTSLLDALSGRSAYDSGVLTIDGQEAHGHDLKNLKRKIAYVKQRDIFFDHLSVRDQLTYTAFLRLPQGWTTERKVSEVDRIISLLRLERCVDSPIRMISGGERKRVNIGTELLTDPRVIILDEPTSGLDSTNAVALLRVLRSLARRQRKTILTSIHQPSSAVFRSFDRLLMLAEGSVVFFGPPTDSLEYLAARGFPCPSGYNAADHWMDLLLADSAHDVDRAVEDDGDEHEEEEGAATVKPRHTLIDAWDGEDVAKRMDDAMDDAAEADASRHGRSTASVKSDGGGLSLERKYNTNWWTQFTVLTHRSLKNSRSAIFTPLNLIKSGLIGLVAGLLWFQTEYTEKSVPDRSSYFFFTMTYWVFDAMFNALMSFPAERDVLFKERASGSYHLSAYFMAKTASEAPTRMALPLFYMVVSYWLGAINNDFLIFLGSTACTLLSVLAGESLGLLIGTSVMDFERAMTVMVVVSLALMLLGGYFVDNIPFFLTWGRFISPFKYAFDASQQLVFNRDVPCDGSGILEEACGGRDEGAATPEEVIDFLNAQGSIGFNAAMLLVMFATLRFVSYVFLRRQKGDERS